MITFLAILFCSSCCGGFSDSAGKFDLVPNPKHVSHSTQFCLFFAPFDACILLIQGSEDRWNHKINLDESIMPFPRDPDRSGKGVMGLSDSWTWWQKIYIYFRRMSYTAHLGRGGMLYKLLALSLELLLWLFAGKCISHFRILVFPSFFCSHIVPIPDSDSHLRISRESQGGILRLV